LNRVGTELAGYRPDPLGIQLLSEGFEQKGYDGPCGKEGRRKKMSLPQHLFLASFWGV